MMKKIITLMLAVVLSFSFMAELRIGAVYAAEVTAEIVPGTLLEISSEGTYSSYYCEFVPEESGWYKYYSTGNCSVRGQIFGSTTEEFLAESDNYQKDFLGLDVITGSFKMIHYFEAGKSYILYSGLVNSSGTYSLGIEKVPKATAMTIMDQDVVDMAIGVQKALKLNFTPEDCEQEKITWVSDNPEVVFIDEDGVSHFKSLGTANVTATTESGLTDSITINVVNHPEILLDEEIVFYAGGGKTGTYTFIPKEDGRYAFSIDVSTLLTAKATVFVEIYDKDYNLVASSTEWSTSEVAYCNMTAKENYYVSYRSSTGDVFGTATAKVTKIGNSANTNPDGIDTTDELWQEGEDISLDNITELKLDEPRQVGIAFENAKSVHKFTPTEDGEYKLNIDGDEFISFSVLNDEFVYLNSGKAPHFVKLEAGKTYVITSSFSPYSDISLGEYTIELTKLPKAERLEITNGETFVGNLWQQIDLTVGYTPEESESEELEWTSSDESVVSVEDGRITLNKIGKATITVTNESGLTDSIEVEVAHYPEIKLGEAKVLTLDTKEVSFTFIPEESGVYNFTAKSVNEEMLLSGKVAKVSQEPEATSVGNQVLNLEYNFEAGEIYYITVGASRAEALGEMEYSIKKDISTAKVGDANLDGIVNAEDALVVLKAAAKLVQLSEEEKVLVDIDLNELINAEDALEILKMAAKL